MTLRALVVDDVPSVAALHAQFLSSRDGCEVIATVGTGPDAVAAIRQHQPDLVLLDIYLPGYSGLEVLRSIRATRQKQPEFIAVTAARDFDSVREARLQGVRHYLVKPFSARDLHERIDDVQRELSGEPVDALSQEGIDLLIRSGSSPRSLPKGLSTDTLALVRDALVDAAWASATEVSEQVGISRVTTRRYLEHLVETGQAERKLDYATAGRPGARYGLVNG